MIQAMRWPYLSNSEKAQTKTRLKIFYISVVTEDGVLGFVIAASGRQVLHAADAVL